MSSNANLPAEHPIRGTFIALASAAILSLTGIFIRHLTLDYGMPPLVLAFWRNIFVVVTLVAALAPLRPAWLRVQRRDLPFLAAFGLALAVFNSLWTVAVATTGAAVATVLVYSSAAFTAVLGWWLLQESLTARKVAAVAASLAGCVLVSGANDLAAWSINAVGIVTGILSGLLYAIYSLMGRSAARRGLNPWTALLYTFGFGAVWLLGFNLAPSVFAQPPASLGAAAASLFHPGLAWSGWLVLFLLAAGPTVLGFGLYNVSLAHLPSSTANLILTIEPVFTAIIAFVVLGEVLTSVQLGGSALIVGGVVLLTARWERTARAGAVEQPARVATS